MPEDCHGSEWNLATDPGSIRPWTPPVPVRVITAVASYYLRMHSLKLQVAFSRVKAIAKTAENAASDNDQLLVQVTYRLE